MLTARQSDSNGKQPAALVDIDGVLADADEVLQTTCGDWGLFHRQVGKMPLLNNGVLPLMEALLLGGFAVVLVTCRPTSCRAATKRWLESKQVPHTSLLTRPESVKPDRFKESVVETMLTRRIGRFVPVLAIDDNPREVAMYQSYGLPTVYIHSGHWEESQPWCSTTSTS